MNHAEADAFAERWARVWNAHDVENVLEHFTDDVVFASPVAAQLLDGSDGVIHGKAPLRGYWTEGPTTRPGLHSDPAGATSC